MKLIFWKENKPSIISVSSSLAFDLESKLEERYKDTKIHEKLKLGQGEGKEKRNEFIFRLKNDCS